MRESVDNLYYIINNDNYMNCLEDKEYEYKTSAIICQRKGLFGYSDFRVDGGQSPEKIYNSVNNCIDGYVQFCRKYDLPYDVSESIDYSGDVIFVGGVKGREKKIRKEIVFTVTSEVSRKLMHDLYVKQTNETKKYFISRSDVWFDRLKNSEAVKAVADEMASYIDKHIENKSDNSNPVFLFKYQCGRNETVIGDFFDNDCEAIEYEKLGYESLGSEEQESAVTAAVMRYILEEYKGRAEIFDVAFQTPSEYGNYNKAWIKVTFKMEKDNTKKSLKSW